MFIIIVSKVKSCSDSWTFLLWLKIWLSVVVCNLISVHRKLTVYSINVVVNGSSKAFGWIDGTTDWHRQYFFNPENV